jgi:predicted transcriptional regulator of viral defense system
MAAARRRRARTRLTLGEYVDALQGAGRYCFTGQDVATAVGGTAAARQAALRRLKGKRRIISPRRGFFVVVPVEYRSAGSPPASWFIDDLMVFQGRSYYVGLLTAAALHGAAHQRPQVFQVVVSVLPRPVEVARLRIEYHRNRNLAAVPVERRRTETGTMRVSTPEATAIDLVRYPEASGHLGNVATVLVELAERIDPAALARVAAKARHPDAQRLGYLLDLLGLDEVARPLAQLVASRRRRPVLLRPDHGAGGRAHHPRWYVIPNAEVTAEL